MDRKDVRERFKFYILVLLIVISLVQVGILWGYQNQGFPISIFTERSQKPYAYSYSDIEKNRDSYFAPYRIIVSTGYDDSHWLIGRKTDSDNLLYNALWSEAKNYIKAVLNSKPLDVLELSDTMWGDLVVEKSFTYEFTSNIKLDIIKWFLNTSSSSVDGPTGIHKMIISPSDNESDGFDTVYIRDDPDSNKVFKYVLSYQSENRLNKEKVNQIITSLSSNQEIRTYNLIREYPIGKKSFFSINQDVLLVSGSIKYRDFYGLTYSVPDICNIPGVNKMAVLNTMADRILGSEAANYELDEGKYGAAVFKKVSSIYRIYKDGLLEYKYLAESEGDRGNIREAFEKAMEFLVEKSDRGQLLSGVNVYLSGVDDDQSKDFYTFTFDYSYSFDSKVGDVPIVFSDYTTAGLDVRLDHAVTIKANSNRVLGCWWITGKYEQGKKTEMNVNFENLMDTLFNVYPNLKNNLFINDISMCYHVDPLQDNVKGKEFRPEWVITSGDGKRYFIDK